MALWVLLDPLGFRETVAANPLLFTGMHVVLALGGLLFLMGFLGCWGAVRENKSLLLLVSPRAGQWDGTDIPGDVPEDVPSHSHLEGVMGAIDFCCSN